MLELYVASNAIRLFSD